MARPTHKKAIKVEEAQALNISIDEYAQKSGWKDVLTVWPEQTKQFQDGNSNTSIQISIDINWLREQVTKAQQQGYDSVNLYANKLEFRNNNNAPTPAPEQQGSPAEQAGFDNQGIEPDDLPF